MANVIYTLLFMFSEDKKQVVLITKNKPDYMAGKLNGVGGKVENDETIIGAARREFVEETGYEGPLNDFRRFAVYCFNDNESMHCFSCTGNVSECTTTTSEKVGVYEVSSVLANNNPDKMFNLNWLIPAALDPDKLFLEINTI